MLNSDDAILSLMNEMSAQQGYEPSKPTSTTTTLERISEDPGETSAVTRPRRPLQIAELDGYPDNDHLAGSHSIWNPYIQPNKASYLPRSSSVHSIPTNPAVEVIRRRAFERFKQEATDILQRIQQSWKIKLPIPSLLEKWHMDAKLEEQEYQHQSLGRKKASPATTLANTTYPSLLSSTSRIYKAITTDPSYWPDPILLSKRASGLFRAALEPEVKKAWSKASPNAQHSLPAKFEKKASQIQKALYRCICQAHDVFQKQLLQAAQLEGRSNSQSTTKKRKLPKVSWDVDKDQYQVTFTGISFQVHAAYYEKLQRLYDRADSHPGAANGGTFEEFLFCILCRYDMLQGAGLQAGVPGKVMDTLLEHFDCTMECFASPLNCRYERFASAFDTDRALGSLGSFFQLDFLNGGTATGGCFQANPPFCERVIQSFNDRMHQVLQKSNQTKSEQPDIPLMFVVFVPVWKESKAYTEGLLENEFLTEHLVLAQSNHWYTEGTQHRRKGSFRVASFDTSIFFYQNREAKRKWPVTKDVLDDLTAAFCEEPKEMDKGITSSSSKLKKPRKKASIASSGKRPTEVDKVQDNHAAPTQETNVPKSKSKKVSTKRKAKNFQSQQEESQAQLDLLASLGLAADYEPKAIGNGSNSSKSASNGPKGQPKKKKRRKK